MFSWEEQANNLTTSNSLLLHQKADSEGAGQLARSLGWKQITPTSFFYHCVVLCRKACLAVLINCLGTYLYSLWTRILAQQRAPLKHGRSPATMALLCGGRHDRRLRVYSLDKLRVNGSIWILPADSEKQNLRWNQGLLRWRGWRRKNGRLQ